MLVVAAKECKNIKGSVDQVQKHVSIQKTGTKGDSVKGINSAYDGGR